MRVATVRELAERTGATGAVRSRSTDGGGSRASTISSRNTPRCARSSERRRTSGGSPTSSARTRSRNGVRYAEVVFSPSNHAPRLGDDWFGPIEAVLDGLEAGRRDFGVTARLAPDLVRDAGLELAERSLEVALKFAGRGVVALNAAGSERSPIAPFGPLFRRAKDAGLRSVPHAGEWAGPRNIWETLEHYLPDRIGHGVRAVDDPALVAAPRRDGIPLEISPVSNVATGVYAVRRGAPVPGAPRRRRHRHAELRRPADVRRVARRRLPDRAGNVGLRRRRARGDRADGRARLVRRRRRRSATILTGIDAMARPSRTTRERRSDRRRSSGS